MKPVPCRLEPQFVPRIWGARTLAPLFPDKEKLAEPIGEVWLTGNDCTFADGPFAGRALGDAWRAMPPEWAGTRLDTKQPFPLLVKFLFPEDILSIQVHPDDEYARLHEAHTGWTGKTEMWHAIAARPGAEVLVGLKEDVTPESFRAAIADGTAEKCLNRISIAAGDTVFVPAGTVHTIGPGLVLCEIQENSDLTYRVFDYNRPGLDGKPRPLHIEKALAVTRFGKQLGGKTVPVSFGDKDCSGAYFVACRYFATKKVQFAVRAGGDVCEESFELLIILEGNGRLDSAHGSVEYNRAQVWFMPARLGAYGLAAEAPTTLLRTYVPDLQRFTRELRDAGVSREAVSRITFP